MRFYQVIIILLIAIACREGDVLDSNRKSIISSVPVKNNRQKADSIMLDAYMNAQQGKKKDVLKVYKAVIDYDTTNSDNFVKYSLALLSYGKKYNALEYINRGIRSDPSNDFAYFIKSAMMTEIFPEAVDSVYFYLNKAIELRPNDVYYLSIRARMYNENEEYEKSIADFTKAIKLRPQNRNLYTLRGIVKASAHQYESALEDLGTIPESRRNDEHAYLSRAYALLMTGRFKECIKDCDTAISINPSIAKSYFIRGSAKSNLDDFDGAYEDIETAARSGDKEALKVYEKLKEDRRKHKRV